MQGLLRLVIARLAQRRLWRLWSRLDLQRLMGSWWETDRLEPSLLQHGWRPKPEKRVEWPAQAHHVDKQHPINVLLARAGGTSVAAGDAIDAQVELGAPVAASVVASGLVAIAQRRYPPKNRSSPRS